MDRLKIILNPIAGQGFAAKAEPEICACLHSEGVQFDLVRTERPWHAAELAAQAVQDGFRTIAVVGGDGTVNEVVNGVLNVGASDTVIGVIPAGRGCDFAFNIGVPNDVREACRRLVTGNLRRTDLGKLVVDGQQTRYFQNILGVGFDAVVAAEVRKVKWLRGLAVYLPVVLKTVFFSPPAPRVRIAYDDQSLELPALMICAANGAREGGGFHIAPPARPDDGWLDLCIAREVGQLEMLRLIPRFMKGTHVTHPAITLARARQIVLTSETPLTAHVDGEVTCTAAHRLECTILPQQLIVRC